MLENSFFTSTATFSHIFPERVTGPLSLNSHNRPNRLPMLKDHTPSSLPASDNEITLIEIWQILVARKWIVLLLPVVALLLASVYLVIIKPVFTSTATLLVGSIGDADPTKGIQVELPAISSQRLLTRYPKSNVKGEEVFPRLVKVSYDKKESGSILSLTAEGRTPQGAKSFLDQVASVFLQEQQQMFETAMQLKHEQVASLMNWSRELEERQHDLSRRIETVQQQNPAQAAILAIEKGNTIDTIQGIHRQLQTLQFTMHAINSFPSKLLQEPTTPNYPSKPKKTLVLALALFLGLISGAMAAFFAEFLAIARRSAHTPTMIDR